MAFTQKIAEMVAYRAAYICSNPECNTLTIGPAMSDPLLKNKKGEAAHINGEKVGAARYNKNVKIDINSELNGIWLCANCHTLIDKNNGIDYSDKLLFQWKRDHEETISISLRSHKSFMPFILKNTKIKVVAQNIVDYISNKGAYFQPIPCEDFLYVINSVKQTRDYIQKELKGVDLDKKTKSVFISIQHSLRDFMNNTSTIKDVILYESYLTVLRHQVGVQLKILRDDVGCNIPGNINSIIS